MRLILGSQSPRRQEILNYFSLPFEQITSNFDEEAHPFRGDPGEYALELAIEKAKTVYLLHPDSVVLTADTVVALDNQIFGKPKDREEAFRTLSILQGKWHSVFTGVAVACPKGLFKGVEETRVLFNPLTAEMIDKYLEALHWADKAGGYAIQLAGSLTVSRIEGCYYNVLGLPINTTAALLKSAGIDLWEYLK